MTFNGEVYQGPPPAIALTMGPWGPSNLANAAAGAFSQLAAVANTAYYIPMLVPRTVVVEALCFAVGTSGSGNYDIGLYDLAGTRLVSSGSTAIPGTNTYIEHDITDLLIRPGKYYLAAAFSSTPSILGANLGAPAVDFRKLGGLLQQSSVFPLPSTATFAVLADNCFFALGMKLAE